MGKEDGDLLKEYQRTANEGNDSLEREERERRQERRKTMRRGKQ